MSVSFCIRQWQCQGQFSEGRVTSVHWDPKLRFVIRVGRLGGSLGSPGGTSSGRSQEQEGVRSLIGSKHANAPSYMHPYSIKSVCERGLSLPCSVEGPHLLRDKALKPGHTEASKLESWVLGLVQEQLPREAR